MLKDKTVLLGVTGSIAAYKIAYLASALVKLHADVHVLMTKNACNFINPITFETLTGNKCLVDTFDRNFQFSVEHVSVAKKADVVMIAPASANVIGKLAHGIADDMLTTTILACRCRKFISPAMNTNMFENPIVQDNLKILAGYGYSVIDPAVGYLACGDTGAGKMPEPETLLSYILQEIGAAKDLGGKKVLVTAGPTQEPIDPVRYITNHSSGKMGYAIAEQAVRMGAKVILVSAPTSLPIPSGVDFISVDSAVSMQEAVEARYNDVNVVIMAAAVSDFRVLHKAEQKIKKMESMTIELVKNPDILQGLGTKKSHQILVGFAAETEHVIKYGQDKVARKNLDMLVANDVSKSNAGFNVDTNEGYFLYPDKEPKEMPNMKKSELARHILREVIDLVANKADIN